MNHIPDPKTFFLTTPPYAAFPIYSGDFVRVLAVQFFHGSLDAHCVECERDGVFQSTSPPLREAFTGPRTHGQAPPITVEQLRDPNRAADWPISEYRVGNWTGLRLPEMEPHALADRHFDVRFSCTRDSRHRLIFYFLVSGKVISKVGQSPSLADLQAADVAKYRKVLGGERYREFTKAIGLHAHGVGIGAFVYLRRQFEWLIGQAHARAAKEPGWDEAAFQRSRMADKISLLKSDLPPFLVENRHIYSILSLGIHELSEAQCLKHFEPVRAGIELILDEEIERQARKEKEEKARKTLAGIKGVGGGKKGE